MLRQLASLDSKQGWGDNVITGHIIIMSTLCIEQPSIVAEKLELENKFTCTTKKT